MKENQQDNRWFDEIRNEMQDFEAKIPADGWERVSSSLAKTSKPAIGIRWIGIAASIFVCMLLGGGYYFFGDITATVIEDPVVAEETTHSRPHFEIAPVENRKKIAEQMQGEVAGAINTEPETAMLQQQNDTIREEETTPLHRDTMLIIPNQEEEMVLLAMNVADAKKKRNAGWSFALHGGINASFIDNKMSSGSQQMGNQPAGGHPSGDINVGPIGGENVGPQGGGDEATSSGIQQPEDQPTGGYQNPDTQVEKDAIIESGKHTSWSFGLSVDRQILPKTTLETGIVYTLLTSDVKMKLSGIKSQKIQYLGIPLRLNYQILGSDQCQLYAGGGVMLEHSISATRGGKSLDVKPWQWSSNLSVGGQFRISNHILLYFEPGVSWYHNADPSVPSLRSESPVYFNIRGGIRILYQ